MQRVLLSNALNFLGSVSFSNNVPEKKTKTRCLILSSTQRVLIIVHGVYIS